MTIRRTRRGCMGRTRIIPFAERIEVRAAAAPPKSAFR